jgi:hypothetical protein
MLQLPTPHYGKLLACLNNNSLPAVDKDRVEEAQNKSGSRICRNGTA